MVLFAGEADHLGICIDGQLDDDGAYPTRCSRYDDGVAGSEVHGIYRGIGCRARDKEGACLLPGYAFRAMDELTGLDQDEFGLAGAVIGESDDFIQEGETPDIFPHFFDDAGEVGTLTGGEMCGPLTVKCAFADRGLARIEARGAHFDEHLGVAGFRNGNFFDVEDVKAAVFVEFDGAEFILGWHVESVV